MKLEWMRRKEFFWAAYAALLAAFSVAGLLGGMLLGYSIDLPRVEELQQVRPNVISYVYSDDGQIIGEFALEKRILVTYDQIPEMLKHAILAAEDSSFFQHPGIDFRRAAITFVRNILRGERKGASTLTMQLCKLRFTSSEKSWERKIKDILFAIETEKEFSKEQIFTLYFNQIYMGHGIYGIAAAADFYFGKTLEELTLSESAMLAGILNAPARYSPILNPGRALRRRAYVLRRMREVGYIDDRTMAEAVDQPLEGLGKSQRETAAYFVEWVRRHLEKNYSAEKIWQGGLKIHTTLDAKMQSAALDALRRGLLDFDKRTRRWSGAPHNLVEEGKDLDGFVHPDWRAIFQAGQLVHGLVTASDEKSATVKLGSYTATLGPDEVAWTGRKKVSDALKRGDVAVFRLLKVDKQERLIEASVERIPEVQGAFLALDNKTGAILAMVGGFDFQYSKFNRATQALRQPGSIFKPFTYVVAIEEGKSPKDTLLDAPVNFVDDLGRPYEPRNSDGEFKGLIPLEQALAESRNVPTIRLANALGIRKIIAMAQRFGIRHDYIPVLPIALGAGELTLEEITSAFSVFGNRGVRAKPYFIRRVEDYNGSTLEENQSEFEHVLSPTVCSKMLYLLRQVVERGTAQRAKAIGRPSVGKTGTTNEATDAWFVGVVPQITAGVWVGYDEKKSLGEKVFGNNVALPIWVDFMKQIDKDLPVEQFSEVYEPSELELVINPSDPDQKPRPTDSIAVEDIPPPVLGADEDTRPGSSRPVRPPR